MEMRFCRSEIILNIIIINASPKRPEPEEMDITAILGTKIIICAIPSLTFELITNIKNIKNPNNCISPTPANEPAAIIRYIMATLIFKVLS